VYFPKRSHLIRNPLTPDLCCRSYDSTLSKARSASSMPTSINAFVRNSCKTRVSEPRTFPFCQLEDQCPFCMSSFCRPSKMMNHVKNLHLRNVSANQTIDCRHPVCKSSGLVLNNLMHFKNHVQRVHGIRLRA
jgi:hypothetical protein